MAQESNRRPNNKTTTLEKRVDALEKRVDALEQCLAKVCHYTGSERVLDEFGIPRWEVKKRDMKRYD